MIITAPALYVYQKFLYVHLALIRLKQLEEQGVRWTLRRRNGFAPHRRVATLNLKLHPFAPTDHSVDQF